MCVMHRVAHGLLDFIERYVHGDPELQSKLTSEMRILKNVELDFGKQSAIREWNTVMLGKISGW